MSVSNGQLANQTTFNNAFGSRVEDTSYAGKQLFLNYTMRDVQDSVAAHSGGGQALATAITKNIAFVTAVAAPADSIKLPPGEVGMEIRIFNLAANRLDLFPATGETINNQLANVQVVVGGGDDVVCVCRSAGAWYVSKPDLETTIDEILDDLDGALADIAELDQQNRFFTEYQQVRVANLLAGADCDVSFEFAGKAPGGADAATGVITDAPNNRVEIRLNGTLEPILGDGMLPLYGRLTEAAGVWTITYYSMVGTTETAQNLPLDRDAIVLFKEVFTKETRPTTPADLGPFLAGSGSGGSSGAGGNGTPVEWFAGDSDGPVEGFTNGMPDFSFSPNPDALQSVYARITVPDDYTVGTAIAIKKMLFWTSATANQGAFRATVKLIRKGTTDVTSAFGVNFGQATFNVPGVANQAVGFDDPYPSAEAILLGNPSGKIDGVDVLPADDILIQFYRYPNQESPAPAAADIKMFKTNGFVQFYPDPDIV